MWSRVIFLFPAAVISSVFSVQAAERRPFHVSHFSDNVVINLTVTSLQTSGTEEYDYDVTIGLTELDNTGVPRFVDQGSHDARVKCDRPGKIFVGGADYLPTSGVGGADWKDDLWKSVCTSPMS